MNKLTVAMKAVIAERERQKAEEGWTDESDDAYQRGVLSLGGVCYAEHAYHGGVDLPPDLWPFDKMWWKPTTPRRDLIKAAALIIAEIERLDREK